MIRVFGRLPILLAVLVIPSFAQESGPPALMVDADFHPYLELLTTDTASALLVNARLPAGFSYFSYQNFQGLFSGGDFRFFRSEHNLRWALSNELPFDLNAQSILVDGDGNDDFQLGIGTRLHDVPDTMPSIPIVTEVQLGMRVVRDLYAVAEYRRNDFRVCNEENIALGVGCKSCW